MIKKEITYEQAVDLFVGANVDWLGPDEQPLVTALYESAKQLDKRTAASLLAEFRQVMKELHKRKPGQLVYQAKDEFEAMMEEFED